MKKLMIAAVAVVSMVATAQAAFWSTWYSSEVQDKDLGNRQCVLGLASEVKSMSGAQLDVCISKAQDISAGCQGAFGYSRVVTLRNGVQFGWWNNAKSASLQFGVVCHNETGFLPWFPFFNFDVKMFGPAK